MPVFLFEVVRLIIIFNLMKLIIFQKEYYYQGMEL